SMGVLPQVPITLGGKTVLIDMMVVDSPLDFNMLLGRDYVYAMNVVVSSLFRVMCFLHEGKVVQLIDQLSFPGSNTATSQKSSLNGLFVSRMSLQPSLHPPDCNK
ncbi:hypothetical protein, partial [Actinobacillus pleuropneumoniae]|uniref:hypothetical protein n=1 Tax=Actinobacillus pleuropneumoniae TaxID=715 RepID=UPI00227BD7E7